MADTLRVLYVDDEHDLLDIGKVFLERSGDFYVTTIDSATAALDLISRERFDAIISDYQMPGMDGIQFLLEVRTKFGQVPFILFTGRGREEVVIQAINSGADFYLQKGGDPSAQFAELAHKIKSAASRKMSMEALRESEERYRAISEYSHNAICIVDGQAKITWVNEEMLTLGGYSRDQLYGAESFAGFIAPESIEFVITNFYRVLAGEPYQHHYTFYFIRADGEKRLCAKHMMDFLDKQGMRNLIISMVDITERTRAEELLRQQTDAMEAARDGMALLNRDQNYIYMNKAHAGIYGYDNTSELIGTSWRLLYGPDELQKFEQEIMPELGLTGHYQGRARGTKKDGSIFHQELSLTALENGGLICVVRDISDWKKAEEQLTESEERYLSLFDRSLECIYIHDLAGNFIDANPAALNLLGYTREDIPHLSFTSLISGEQLNTARETIKTIVETGTHTGLVEYRLQAKNGGFVDIETKGSLILHDEKPRAIFGIARDITGRKRAEMALVESERKYRDLFESSHDAIMTLGPPSWKFTSCNQATLDLFGASSEADFVSLGSWDIAPEFQPDGCNSFEKAEEMIENALRNGSFSFEWMHKRIDGTEFASTVLLTRMERNGVVSLQATVREISGCKTTEKALLESENLYRTVFNNTGTATVIIGPDTTILRANDGWIHLTGVPRKEQENKKSWTVFFDSGDVDRMKHYHYARRTCPADPPSVYECRLIDAKNAVHHCIAQVSMIPGTKNSVASVVDISDRIEKEKLFQTIFENMGTALIIIEEDTTMSHVNAGMEPIWGYKKEEIEGRVKWPTMVVKEDLEKMLESHRLRRLDPGSAPGSYEFRLIHKTGELRDVALTAALVPGTKKSVISLRDITEFNKTVKALKESEDKYRHLFRYAGEAIVVAQDGMLRLVNPRTVELTGYPEEDLLTMPFLSFVHPSHQANLMSVYAGLLDGSGEKISSRYSLRLITREGSTKWVEISAVAIGWEGRPATLNFLTDITTRKIAEESLKESEEFNRELVENMPDMVIVYGHDRKVRYTNPAVTRMLGYSTEEQAGADILDYVVPEQRDKVGALIQQRLTSGSMESIEADIQKKDGGCCTVTTKSSTVHYQGEPAVLLLLTDITEQNILVKEMEYHEQELMQFSASLARANKKLNLLYSITRHDITNQLAVLQGYRAMLEKKQPDSQFAEYFQKINAAATRISVMVQFTREYEEIGVHNPAWQDTRTLVDTAAKEAPLGKITVKNLLPSGNEMLADPLVIKVFYNLMDNAVRYGGKITTISFFMKPSDGDQIIICEDDGGGVPADEKEKIFLRGFGKNTGLGLALSQEILSITGITIRETGEPGVGARFEMTVPNGMWRTAGNDA